MDFHRRSKAIECTDNRLEADATPLQQEPEGVDDIMHGLHLREGAVEHGRLTLLGHVRATQPQGTARHRTTPGQQHFTQFFEFVLLLLVQGHVPKRTLPQPTLMTDHAAHNVFPAFKTAIVEGTRIRAANNGGCTHRRGTYFRRITHTSSYWVDDFSISEDSRNN